MLDGRFCDTLANQVVDMIRMIELSSQINMLSNALDIAEQNHRVISQNIANVNTPGYKTKRLDFDSLMKSLDAKADETSNVGSGSLEIDEVEGLPERPDHNNVNLEREISELKKNALLAQTYTHLVASRLSTIRKAISR